MSIINFPGSGGGNAKPPLKPEPRTPLSSAITAVPAYLSSRTQDGLPIGKQGPCNMIYGRPSCGGVWFLLGIEPIPEAANATAHE